MKEIEVEDLSREELKRRIVKLWKAISKKKLKKFLSEYSPYGNIEEMDEKDRKARITKGDKLYLEVTYRCSLKPEEREELESLLKELEEKLKRKY